jgi:hypothetical protein
VGGAAGHATGTNTLSVHEDPVALHVRKAVGFTEWPT